MDRHGARVAISRVTGQASNAAAFRACIFDFDGVIVDSEPLHHQAKRETLERFGVAYPPGIFAQYKGRPDRVFFEFVAAQLAPGVASAKVMHAFKEEKYLSRIGSLQLVDGVSDFLPLARAGFDKLGLATSATQRDYAAAARRHQLDRWFDAIVTAEDTTRHKPDPEPYQRALARLAVPAAAALVIEDSPNGIRSARAAGCVTVGLATTFAPAELRAAGADAVVASFATLADLLHVAASRTR